MTDPADRYLTSDYLEKNPSWDIEDSSWKANKVTKFLSDNGVNPTGIAEVGCGAGAVLATMRSSYPRVPMIGYDIAPDASRFWPQHASKNIEYHVGDFLERNQLKHDVVLVLDVIEHLTDPFSFLIRLQEHGRQFVFHVPLDLSALSVAREKPLMYVREKVGHIHYFTKNLALEMLRECGYEIVDWRYSNAYMSAPSRGWRTWLARLPRALLYALHKDFFVRVIGGETLLVLAIPRNEP